MFEVFEVFEVFEEENILARSMALGKKLGQRFTQWQEQFASVENVRHLGSMAAFDLVTADHKPNAELTAAMCKRAREKGLILIVCGFYGNTLRFLMPVTIEDEVLEEGQAIVETCLAELAG
ncbi:MAG: aminotransferase class III-fold pyridoxal phosphate-dependent enzyme [Marinobacter sp.]